MAKTIKLEELGLKKTMVAVATQLISEGIQLSDAVIKIMQPAEGSTTSNGPREITILKDAQGEQLGRKCNTTGLFYSNEFFSKGTSNCKIVDGIKGKLYGESKAMEKEAQTLVEEARDITDVGEKVAKYEAYDKLLIAAKAHRNAKVEVTDEMNKGGFESINDLATDLKVDVDAHAKAQAAEKAEKAADEPSEA